MAKRTSKVKLAKPAASPLPWDLAKFENMHQIGGIQTATLDTPAFGPGTGSGQGTRVAFINTGSGLRFTVALDRGGDIIDAWYHQHCLAYLSPVGLKPPRQAAHSGLNWLDNWAGGLVTSCGPIHMGGPREEDGVQVSIHGHHSNTPASVEMILNPDLHRSRREMLLSLVIRDARMFGPVIEVRRQIQCVLGHPQVIIYDQITNRGDQPCAHNWLYHVNLGYPLLDEGAQLVFAGKQDNGWEFPGRGFGPLPAREIAAMKRVPHGLKEHAGSGERGVIIDNAADKNGHAHAGLINPRLGIGFELEWEAHALPRLANWQHYGTAGSYVCGLEPFTGSLVGKAKDKHKQAGQMLAPGETRRYQLTLRVHHTPEGAAQLRKHDGAVD